MQGLLWHVAGQNVSGCGKVMICVHCCVFPMFCCFVFLWEVFWCLRGLDVEINTMRALNVA